MCSGWMCSGCAVDLRWVDVQWSGWMGVSATQPLPRSSPAVGGASTMAELAANLLNVRYDVSALTAFDLLRLDYKQARS